MRTGRRLRKSGMCEFRFGCPPVTASGFSLSMEAGNFRQNRQIFCSAGFLSCRAQIFRFLQEYFKKYSDFILQISYFTGFAGNVSCRRRKPPAQAGGNTINLPLILKKHLTSRGHYNIINFASRG